MGFNLFIEQTYLFYIWEIMFNAALPKKLGWHALFFKIIYEVSYI